MLAIGALYIALIGRYNAFDIDTPWFLSFSRSFWNEHVNTDLFMRGVFPDGMGGVIAFGKLAAIVQGAILSVLGWSLTAATLVSITCVLISLLLFAAICRRLGFSAYFMLCFIALLGLTDPFVAAAERGRYEFLAVLMLSLGFWLAARGSVVLSMFLAALATELEPVAAVVVVATAIFLVSTNRRPTAPSASQLIPRMAGGAAMAAAVFFLLHPHTFAVFRSADWNNLHKGNFHLPGGFVTAYYVVYRRHLPELALLGLAILRCFGRDKQHLFKDWPALCIAALFCLAILLHWPNIAYFALIAPFTCLFIVQALYVERYGKWILAAIILLTVPQYMYRFKPWSPRLAALSAADQREVDAAISRVAVIIGKPAEQLNLVGNYALWFAHPHGFVNLNKKIVSSQMFGNADVVLCFDKPFAPTATVSQEITCPELDQANFRLAEKMQIQGRTLRLLLPMQPAANSFAAP